MRPSRLQILLLALVLPISVIAPEALALDNTFQSLRGAIRLYEIRTDQHNRAAPLAFTDVPQDVDINSVIRIHVSSEKLLSDAMPVSAEIRKMVDSLDAIAPELRNAIQLIGDTLSDVNRLVRMQNRESAEFKALATIIEKRLRQWALILQSYAKALTGAPDASVRQRADLLNQQIRRSLGAANGTDRTYEILAYEFLVDVLRDEVRWVTEMVDRAAQKAAEKAPTVALVVVARAFIEGQGAQRIHLPHYDNLEPGQLQSLSKINWAADSAEIRRLLKAARPVAEAIAQVNAQKDNLGDSLVSVFRTQGMDLRPLMVSLKDLQISIEKLGETDWAEEGKNLLREILVLLETEELVQGQVAVLEEMRTSVESVKTDIEKIMNSFNAFEASLASHSMDNLIRRVDRESGQVDSLLAFVDGVDSTLLLVRQLEEGVDGFARLLKRQLDSLQQNLKSVNALVSKLGQLPDNLRQALEPKMSAFIELHTSDMMSHFSGAYLRANALLKKIIKLSPEQKSAALYYAATDFPVTEDALYVLGNQIKNSYLDLRTVTNRKEKSSVVIDARLFRAERLPAVEEGSEPQVRIGNQIEQETQQFVMWRFGLYSVHNVGAAYVQSQNAPEGQTEEASQLAIQTSWLFGYRSWIRDTSQQRPALLHQPWWNDLRLGPHAVALDMDNDNQQEVGFGLTLSYRDLIQIGYGFNLAVDNEPYYFIGLQILDFGRSRDVESRAYEGRPP